jgi:hypothetical protein
VLQLPRAEPTVQDLADWAELQCIVGPDATLGAAVIEDYLRDELGLDDSEEFSVGAVGVSGEELSDDLEYTLREERRAESAEGLGATSQLTESVLAELSFRAQVVGPLYPIAIDDAGLRRASSWGDSPTYPFLTLLSARVLYKLDIGFHLPAKLFEQVVAYALARYIGGVGERFGWPRLEGEPVEDFKTKVKKLARRMGEDPGLMRNIGEQAKDYALDVIAWRGFPDGKAPGQSVIVCQCAIGDDWQNKPLSTTSWREVIAFTLPPAGALAFPLVPSREEDQLHRWHDIASKENLPLDRLRIASLIQEEDMDDGLLAELKSWITSTTAELPFTPR